MLIRCTNQTFGWTYRRLLKAILGSFSRQKYSKGEAYELFAVQLEITNVSDEAPTFYNRWQPLQKLDEELRLYLKGETDIQAYHTAGVKGGDYAAQAGELVNTYPTFMKQGVHLKPYQTRNNVISLWNNQFLKDKFSTSQTPCISQINVQNYGGSEGGMILIITQRSADASLGVPADVYQMWQFGKILERMWKRKFTKMVFNFNNIHIYENNVKETKRGLKNGNKCEQIKYKFIQN